MLTIDDITVREIRTLAKSMNIEVSVRTVWNWADCGKFGEQVGYARQGRLYNRAKVERFLEEKAQGVK
jgi:hypothetical protein